MYAILGTYVMPTIPQTPLLNWTLKMKPVYPSVYPVRLYPDHRVVTFF